MNILVNMHATWQNHLKPLFNLPSMTELNREVLPKCVFYPEANHIFNVFTMPLNEVKVVILGQDPYPQPKQAIGYSFAVNKDVAVPKSLKIIQNELLNNFMDDKNLVNAIDSSEWRTLKHWREQGVFLLNTALTVEKGRAGSHTKLWKPFTNEVIKLLAKQNPIWLLWGAHAQAYEKLIQDYTPVAATLTESVAKILKAAHPASESYPGNKGNFYGCNHFLKVNEMLESEGKQIINW